MFIVITGSSKGIGKFLYKNLKKKATVIGISRSHGKCTDLVCDISEKKQVEETFKKIQKIDVLINNASITDLYKDKLVNFEKTISVNLNGSFYCSHYALSKLKKSKVKKIVNISSINAHVGFPNNPGYVSSKGAINALTKSLAVDYGKYGIKVNSLSLGYISEGMSISSYNNTFKRNKRSSNTILNRWGSPTDVFGAINFLIFEQSNYITGSDIVIDGGWLAKGLK
ncbi:FabG Dehydrogenases with different specificities (related to short-chain alcohol dehydrogenases) [Candidatus Pelagibacterales bacterium]